MRDSHKISLSPLGRSILFVVKENRLLAEHIIEEIHRRHPRSILTLQFGYSRNNIIQELAKLSQQGLLSKELTRYFNGSSLRKDTPMYSVTCLGRSVLLGGKK